MKTATVLDTHRENNRTYAKVICPTCEVVYKTRLDHLVTVNYQTECKSCSSKRKGLKHGFCKERLYRVHQGMKSRCRGKTDHGYKYYGGRGIDVCSEWEEYANFRKWSMANGYKAGLTIDRKNNDGDYEPSNCRWVDRFCQAQSARVLSAKNTSGYRGVSDHKGARKFMAEIMVNGIKHYLGLFDTALEGAKAHDSFAVENSPHTSINGV